MMNFTALAHGQKNEVLVKRKTAETIAAVAGHTEVTKEDIREASRLALPHRMRRRPFEEQTLDWTEVDKVIDDEA